MSSLRARQLEHEARVNEARGRAGGDAAQVMARRLEVMNIRAQQSLAEGDRLIEEVVDGIKAARNPPDALLEGRVRVAEYLASQEGALLEAQTQLARRQEGETR
jgi:hypothetical protein